MEKTITKKTNEEMMLREFLRRKLDLTPNQVRQAKYRYNGICVNGERRRVNTRIFPGDEIAVKIEDEELTVEPLLPYERELDVLYEDEDLLIVNKPAGIVVHPSKGHYEDSLANMLVYYFGHQIKIRAIGRLDKDTSGVVVFAKNQVAAQRLFAQRQIQEFRKEYLALADGHLPEQAGTVSQPLDRDPEDKIRRIVTEEGKEAITHYTMIQEYPTYSLVSLQLDTGRTHQIRVHMSWLGHPLLGDELYGTVDDRMSRAALHAWKMTLQHPFTGETIAVTAPLPDDMKILIGR